MPIFTLAEKSILNIKRNFMRKILFALALMPVALVAQKWSAPEMKGFRYPDVEFVNQAAHTRGWAIYDSLIPNPEAFIQQHAKWVVETLYWHDEENIPPLEKINYRFEDKEGISAKSGGIPVTGIFYSSRWVEHSMESMGADKVLYETRGVLYHELTHAYQFGPRGAGHYRGPSKDRKADEYWVFTEGLADAVRTYNGFFDFSSRRPGGHWMDGYRTTGFFLHWLTMKDADFLRKFNRTAQDIEPWSFDKAMQSIFGENVTTDKLWEEYQHFLVETRQQKQPNAQR